MGRAKVFIKGVDTQILDCSVSKESDRAVDVSNFTFAPNTFPEFHDLVEYLQDYIDLDKLELFFGFEDNILEESSRANDGRMVMGNEQYIEGKRRGIKAFDFDGDSAIVVDESEPQEVARSSLLARYTLNDTLKEDSRINTGVDGLITGSETYIQGKFKKAFDFDGASDISIINEILFDHQFNDDFSFSFWFNAAANPSTEEVLISKSADETNGYMIKLKTGGEIQIQIRNTVTTNEIDVETTTANIPDGEWHHVVITYTGAGVPLASNVQIYIDNVLETNVVNVDTLDSSILNNAVLVFGAIEDETLSFTGQMDDIRLYS